MAPYADAWDNAQPSGAAQADTIDEHIRLVRTQLTERMEDVLIEDMEADPWVLKGALLGSVTAKELIIPSSDFVSDTGAELNYTSNGFHVARIEPMYCPIKLPVGVTITKIELMANLQGFSWYFRSHAFGAVGNSVTLISTVVHPNSVATHAISDTGVIAIPVVAGTIYWLEFGNSGITSTLAGVRITYDTPSHNNTI